MQHLVLSVYSSRLYGATLCVVEHAVALREHGLKVHVVLNEEGPLEDRLRREDIPYSVFPFAHFGLRGRLFQPNMLRKLWRALLSRARYVRGVSRLLKSPGALLHAHTINAVYSVLAARWAGCPAVWHIHEPRERTCDWRFKAFLVAHLPHRVIFVSRAIRDQYRVPSPKAHVLYNFVDVPPPPPDHPPPDAPLRIAWCGQFIPRKDPLAFLALCERLKEQRVPFRAVMAGEGTPNMTELIRERIDSAGLCDQVTRPGYLSDVPSLLRDSDVLVLTSRQDPLPRVVMEAMAFGLAVVASNVDGVAEMVEHGETGFLFELDDRDAAVEALVALQDPQLRDRMGQHARQRAEQLFSKTRYVAETEAVYASLV